MSFSRVANFLLALSSVAALTGVNLGTSKTSIRFLPSFLLLQAENVANSTVSLRCELLPNKRLHSVPIVEIVGQGEWENYPEEPCSFHGFATFTTLQNRTTKCLINLCEGFIEHGFAWLPRTGPGKGQDYLFFEFGNNRSSAKFWAQLPATKETIVRRLKNLARIAKAFPDKWTDEDERIHQQLLKDSYPPHWLHLRIAFLYTVEAYKSNFVNGNIRRALGITFLITNWADIVYSQLDVSVHLTRVIIWPDYNASSEVIPMPESDWMDEEKLLEKLGKHAEDWLWPRIGKTADFVVVIRNLDRNVTKGDTPRYMAAKEGTICRGTANSNYGWGSTLAISGRNLEKSDDAARFLAPLLISGLGRAFGIPFDTRVCECHAEPGRRCVMDPGFTEDQSLLRWEWTDCSERKFAEYVKRIPATCLKTVPFSRECNTVPNDTKEIRSICRNGIVEPGEDCDCGPGDNTLPKHFPNILCPNETCCDRMTCKLKQGAKCAFGPCCDTAKCDFKTKDTLCRAARSEVCDFPEYCNGKSANCTKDRYLMDGSECKDPYDGTCYQGKCASRDAQCLQYLGALHVQDSARPTCYSLNRQGVIEANCGHGLLRRDNGLNEITPCEEADIECGNLMCEGLVRTIVDSFFHYKFRTRLIDRFTCSSFAGTMLPDNGHVQDGVLCGGEKKFCFGQRCNGTLPICKESLPCDNEGKHCDYPNESTTTTQKTTTGTSTSTSTTMEPISTSGTTLVLTSRTTSRKTRRTSKHPRTTTTSSDSANSWYHGQGRKAVISTIVLNFIFHEG